MTEQQHTVRMGSNSWVAAAQAVSTSRPSPTQESAEGACVPRPVFVAAHGGAGATAWAAILGGIDGGAVDTWMGERREGPVVLVARASADGINAAKMAIQRHGAGCFSSVVVVPAGPGRLPRALGAELKVLNGAVDTVRAPWLPRLLLKRAGQASAADLSAKDLTRISTGLTMAGVELKGDNE